MPEVQKVLEEIGFTELTEIQAQVIPVLLEKQAVDLHGQAQTGTGKTLAFGLPLVHRLDKTKRAVQALVVAPTRELAVQINESLQPFVRALGLQSLPVYGGVSMEEQVRTLRRGVHLVIGTPGRLNDHVRRGTLKLGDVRTLILDEADIMLEMGFREEVEDILNKVPNDRQIWLFSATIKPGVQALMRDYMHNPITLSASRGQVGAANTKQYYCVVPMAHRFQALCRFIEAAPEFYGFIFCQTKLLTSELADKLTRQGYQIGALHGDLSQSQRNAVIKKFKSREYSIVVATDVAGRGIDIQDLTHVVNYSLPEDYESYVHRTGRTGRAGKEGIAITFLGRQELRDIPIIERKFKISITPIDVPARDLILKKRIEGAAAYLDSLKKENGVDETLFNDLVEMVNRFDSQELSSIVAHVVYDKFLRHVANGEDVDFSKASVSVAQNAAMREVSLAIGTDDGVSRDDVIGLLEGVGAIPRDQLQKVRIIRRRTFIEVPTAIAAQLLELLRDASLGGRQVRAHIVDPQQRSPERSGGGGRFFRSPRHSGGRPRFEERRAAR